MAPAHFAKPVGFNYGLLYELNGRAANDVRRCWQLSQRSKLLFFCELLQSFPLPQRWRSRAAR